MSASQELQNQHEQGYLTQALIVQLSLIAQGPLPHLIQSTQTTTNNHSNECQSNIITNISQAWVFDLANGASAVPTRQQKQQQWARI